MLLSKQSAVIACVYYLERSTLLPASLSSLTALHQIHMDTNQMFITFISHLLNFTMFAPYFLKKHFINNAHKAKVMLLSNGLLGNITLNGGERFAF